MTSPPMRPGYHAASWTPPVADVVEPPRRRDPVRASIPVIWPAQFRGTVATGQDGSNFWQGMVSGTPMEAIPDGAPLVDVWVDAALGGKARLERIPLPKYPWLTGHPLPGGAYDRRWIGVHSDGSCWEVIALRWVPGGRLDVHPLLRWLVPKDMPPGAHWEAMQAGLFNAEGELVRGSATTAARVSNAGTLLTPQALEGDPFTVGLVLSDYGKAKGSDGKLNVSFPLVGQHVRIPPLLDPPADYDGDALALWRLGQSHGFLIRDRSGAKQHGGVVIVQSGQQWHGTNLDRFRVPLDQLELVTA